MPLPGGFRTRFRQIGSSVAVLKLLVVLSLVAPAAILIFTTWQSRALLLDSTASRASRMSDLLAQHATAAFDGYNLAFSRIEEHLLHAEAPLHEQALHAYLGAIDREMKSVDGIVVVGPDWVPIAHSRVFPVPQVSVGDRDYIRNLQGAKSESKAARDRAVQLTGRDGLVVGVPVTSRYSGGTVLVGARARKDIAGLPSGALLVSVSPSYFEDVYRTLALTDRDRVALVRSDSRVPAQAPAQPGRQTIDPEAAARRIFVPVASAAAADEAPRLVEGTRDDVYPADGTRRISGLRKLDGYPVFVELGYSVDAVLEPWRRQFLANALVAVLTTLLLYAAARLALSKVHAEAGMQALVLAETRRRAQAEAALRQSQKMEALGQLTGGIAHDFNNLLNIVLMNLELAVRRIQETGSEPKAAEAARLEGQAKLEGYVRGALQGAERGVALTHRLLRFAHHEESEPSELRVADLVMGLADLLRQAVGSQARLTLDCPRTLPPVRVDADELETALLNLVVNARDAMPGGGRVQVAAREERTAPDDGSAAARFVVVSVTDTGRGMDAAMLARATEPFFTTKEAGKGSGLGLTTVERFAIRAGGSLRLESRPGAGTKAEIRLPAL